MVPEAGMKTQSLRMPDGLASKLDHLARTTRRSKTSHILEALEKYLEDQEDLEIALARVRDPGAEWVDHAEAKRVLSRD
jgi:RHH-type transcriptional regulator, rel operon repressor / antitoxin RelB